jgi:hypothetical protein
MNIRELVYEIASAIHIIFAMLLMIIISAGILIVVATAYLAELAWEGLYKR